MKKWFLFISIFCLVFGVLIYEAKAKVLPLFPVSNQTGYQEYSIGFAFNGTNYLIPVSGCKPDLTECFLKAVFLDRSGNKTNESTIKFVSNGVEIVGPNAAYSPDHQQYLVVWLEDNHNPGSQSKIKARFISSNGTLLGSELTIATYTSEPSDGYVGYGGGKFLVVYNKPYTYNNETRWAVYGRFVSTNGTLGGEFKISSLWGEVDAVLQAMEFDGSKFLVVYREDGNDTDILARFVDPNTGPKGSEIVINQDGLPSDNPYAVFFDGEKFFVVYTNEVFKNVWQFYGRFVYRDGRVSEITIPITNTKSQKILPIIAFDGAKYLVTWSDGRNCGFVPTSACSRTGYDIYGRYISKTGALLGNEFLVYANPDNEVGGFAGKTSSGKALGLILKPITPGEDGVILGDLFGSFWVSSNYDVFAPDNKEKIKAGNNYTIRWRAPATAKRFDLYYSNDNKLTWHLIASNVTTRSKAWLVPPQNGRKPNSFIRIVAKDDNNNILNTFYSRPFSIEVAKITYPSGGEILPSGQYIEIQWETFGLNATVAKTVVQYSTDGGQTWKNIKTVNGNPGYVGWNIPFGINSSICRVRVIFKGSAGQNIAITETDAVFSILPLN
jgi:hypothetical protein